MNILNLFRSFMFSSLLGFTAFGNLAYANEESTEETSFAWVEDQVEEANAYLAEVYDTCVEYAMSLKDTVLSAVMSNYNETQNVGNEAKEVLEERNLAAENRAKDLQNKTGFKGTETNMDKVVESNELNQ